jgi:FKBP-type peptidyl-prolyl cis-trans isomerase
MDMKRRFFSGAVLLTALIMMTFSSCFDFIDDQEKNTPEKEQELLQQYITGLISKGLDVDTTALGVYYVRQREGTGPFPVIGDTISVKYMGYLMDNSVFDSSFRNTGDSVWTYALGSISNIPGWDDMMPLMNKGSKMEFVVPSHLGFGDQGALYVPPYASLIFVAVMDDVRKKQ